MDVGTDFLLQTCAEQIDFEPQSVADLASGSGPLALWAAQRWPASRLWGGEDDLASVQVAQANAVSWAVDDRLAFTWWSAGEALPLQAYDLIFVIRLFTKVSERLNFPSLNNYLRMHGNIWVRVARHGLWRIGNWLMKKYAKRSLARPGQLLLKMIFLRLSC